MNQPAQTQSTVEDDDAAERALLIAAVEEARADPFSVDHEEVRAWLLEVAAGNFDAPGPVAR